MTEQERIEAFRREVQASGARYGVDVQAIAQPEQLGAVVQVRAVLVFHVREDWKSAESEA
jgi:hypothetical protein